MSKPTITEEQKIAMQVGRIEVTIVRNYLNSLREKAKPGRRRTVESVERAQQRVDEKIDGCRDPYDLLLLIQERRDLADEHARLEAARNDDVLRDEFIAIAKDFSDRKGVSYEAWREVGVPAAVLQQAGVKR